MYAVILAGGGGTRLYPLSRPERPKPFLPLVDDRSLLQHTVDRLRAGGDDRLTDDIVVVTAANQRDLVAEQLPDIEILTEPTGRNTAAAIALATTAIDRPDDEVMLVLPADAWIDPAREGVYREVLRAAGRSLATGSFAIESPLVALGTQVTRPATEYGYLLPDIDSGAEIDGLMAYPVQAFEEKPKPARADQLADKPGVAWNAGMFLWRRRAIRAALQRYTGLVQLIEPTLKAPTLLGHAYDQLKPVSIDYAVMESAARDGQVVMGSMDVGWSDLGSWTALLTAIGARGEGAVIKAGETTQVDDGDLVVRRLKERLGVVVPPERGSMTAMQPIAVLRGTGPDRAIVERLLERCSEGED
jgi:mannose-1-phosphate guanylyltransferase